MFKFRLIVLKLKQLMDKESLLGVVIKVLDCDILIRKFELKLHLLLNKATESNRQKYNTIYRTPPLGQDMTQGQFLSGV